MECRRASGSVSTFSNTTKALLGAFNKDLPSQSQYFAVLLNETDPFFNILQKSHTASKLYGIIQTTIVLYCKLLFKFFLNNISKHFFSQSHSQKFNEPKSHNEKIVQKIIEKSCIQRYPIK